MRQRLPRILLNVATSLSLMVCLAITVTWVRSYFVNDYALLGPAGASTRHTVQSALGVLRYTRQDADGPIRDEPERIATRITDDVRTRIEGRYAGVPLRFGFGAETSTASGRVFVRVHSLFVPYWALLLLFIAMPLVRSFRYVRRLSRRTVAACPDCGYDLRATPERCPECGRAAPTPAARPPG